MNTATHPCASAGATGIHCLKALEVISPDAAQRLAVELEIGDTLWLLDATQQILMRSRTRLEEGGWTIVEAKPADGYTWGNESGGLQ
jgi:hypothetical protein